MIIGCDYHPAFQQIAFVDTDPGELQEQRLQHREETEKFYRNLAAQGMKVRVGMEASGHARWLERLLAELQFELWIGDASEIRSKRVRKEKTDRQDAQLILRLMMEDRFPRIWVPSWENRDLRQLLWHRHRMVQARTRIMNQLQAGALNERPTLQEAVVGGGGTRATGGVSVSSAGEPAARRSAAVAGPIDSHDCRANASHRAGSGEMSCGAATEDASRSGFAYGAGLRADHRNGGSVSVWQADRELEKCLTPPTLLETPVSDSCHDENKHVPRPSQEKPCSHRSHSRARRSVVETTSEAVKLFAVTGKAV